MIQNYLKVALRYLLRYKEYTAINILGLAVGITCCILIMLFVRNEFSYDRFHTKADRLYRVWQHEKYEGQDFINVVTPLPAAAAMQAAYPEIESTCHVYYFSPMVKVGESSFSEPVVMVDSTFFRMFDFELTEGNRGNPFTTPSSVILTEELAKKYFGTVNAMGKTFEIQLGDTKLPVTVGGISKRSPEASSIKYQLLLSYTNSQYIFRPRAFNNWFNVFLETYVLLKPGVSTASLEKKFPAMVKQHLGQDYREGGFVLHLQPITDIHLNTTLPSGNEPTSNPKYSYILGTIGILILFVACINFITLSIGRSATRAMEVGVRKVLGAYRYQLIRQFWGEAFLLTLVAVLLGLALSAILVKPFNQLINQQLTLQFDAVFLLFCLLMIAIIGLVAGVYPAFILSAFRPVEVLKGKLKMKSRTGWLRQSLVVGQFVASIAMIVCTIIIGEQMSFLRNKDLGYNKDQVVVVSTNKNRAEGGALGERYRQQLAKYAEVNDATVSVFSFAESPWAEIGFTDDKKVYHGFQYNSVDARFINSMGLKMKEGRAFSEDNPADGTTAAIVNEAFLKEFNLTDPIGKKLPGPFDQQIIGVVSDFNFESLHTKVRPLLLTVQADSVLRRTENIGFSNSPQPRISVRLKSGSMTKNIELLREAWKAVAPNQDFEYRFLDDTIAAQYRSEQRTTSIVRIASALSIFIACMGLFGLATLAVVRRTKEIGIRKVLGASVSSIVNLLSKDFLKLVSIAAIIAFPLAWWFMNDWLKDFAYRVNISWWVFVAAGVLALLIALGTVSFQAMRAAWMNPVKSLRTE